MNTIKTTNTDKAVFNANMPVNPLPFLNRMAEIIKEHGTDAKYSYNYKANLLLLILQAYPDSLAIDFLNELERLLKSLPPIE